MKSPLGLWIFEFIYVNSFKIRHTYSSVLFSYIKVKAAGKVPKLRKLKLYADFFRFFLYIRKKNMLNRKKFSFESQMGWTVKYIFYKKSYYIYLKHVQDILISERMCHVIV